MSKTYSFKIIYNNNTSNNNKTYNDIVSASKNIMEMDQIKSIKQSKRIYTTDNIINFL